MNLDESVSRNPDVMSGELVFAGTRVPVKTLFDYLAGGHPLDEFLADFPSVRKETAKHVIAASCETIELMCPSKKIA